MTRLLTTIILLACGQLIGQTQKYRNTFHVIKLSVDTTQIHWTTTDESGQLPFDIEQYFCGTWTKVGEVMGKGTADTNSYSLNVHFHDGENLFRVVQWDPNPRLSHPVKFQTKLSDIEFVRDKETIKFNRQTLFKLLKQDTVIKTGYDRNVDISYLKKGKYKLCFDIKTETITIK